MKIHIYSDTGRSITLTLLGRHLWGSLPAVSSFFQLKEEFLIKKSEILAAKPNNKMKMTFDKGSRVLPELAIGDKVRIQNQTTLRKIKWDRTGMITDILRDRWYSILVKGS